MDDLRETFLKSRLPFGAASFIPEKSSKGSPLWRHTIPAMSNAKATYQDLLDSKQLIVMATINDDGTPQTSPVWFEFRDDHIFINSAKGRKKDRNIRARPTFSGTIVDAANPYRYVEVRGEVIDITEEGGDAHIDFLAKRYLGVDSYPYRNAQETRVIYKIKPSHFVGMG